MINKSEIKKMSVEEKVELANKCNKIIIAEIENDENDDTWKSWVQHNIIDTDFIQTMPENCFVEELEKQLTVVGLIKLNVADL